MFSCCGAKKLKHTIEAFPKIHPQDKKSFMLKAKAGQNLDPYLLSRVSANNKIGECPTPNNHGECQKLIKGYQTLVKKKVAKSDYEELIAKYQNTNKLWTDPDFPLNNKSYGISQQKVVWKRASQIIEKPIFVSDNFTPSDILQGKLGNCYFLSAVAGIAEKPFRIKKLFDNTQINKNGIYMARLLHRGVYQEVVVDDYFPCNDDGQILCALPAGGTEIWVMILEKCWAKLFGSYDAIDGGIPNQVLHSFTGAPTYNFRVVKGQQQFETLWSKMLQADQKGHIICCGTQDETKRNQQALKKAGLAGGHAYTILGVYEQSYRMLKIRNPWGSMEWKGVANDNDEQFWSGIDAQEQLRLGFKNGEDGVFFMLFQDFQKYFVIVDICQIEDNASYLYIEKEFQNAAPQCFDFNTQGGEHTIIITQQGERWKKAKAKKQSSKFAHSSVILARALSNNQFQYVESKMEQNNQDLYFFTGDLTPGKYIVWCFLQGFKDSISATFSIYSEANFYIIESKVALQQFLSSCFLNHARNNQSRQIINKNPLEWVCFEILVEKCGIGYTCYHVDKNGKNKICLQFDESQYIVNNLELLPPLKGSKKIKLICKPGEQIILLCKIKIGSYNYQMPLPKIYRLT